MALLHSLLGPHHFLLCILPKQTIPASRNQLLQMCKWFSQVQLNTCLLSFRFSRLSWTSPETWLSGPINLTGPKLRSAFSPRRNCYSPSCPGQKLGCHPMLSPPLGTADFSVPTMSLSPGLLLAQRARWCKIRKSHPSSRHLLPPAGKLCHKYTNLYPAPILEVASCAVLNLHSCPWQP